MEPTFLSPRAFRERGAALFMALIMLVAMSVAAISLVRTVDSTILITGNLAFKQAALQLADYGIEAAADDLEAIPSELTWSSSDECTVPNGDRTGANYYPLRFDEEDVGNPTIGGASMNIAGVPSLDWNKVSCVTHARIPAGYFVQYVIDRQCLADGASGEVSNTAANCTSQSTQAGGSKKSGATAFTNVTAIHHRVTVRVLGPQNAQSFIQVTLRK